jgi:hypothetical protein
MGGWQSREDFDAWWTDLLREHPNKRHSTAAKAKALEQIRAGELERAQFDEGYAAFRRPMPIAGRAERKVRVQSLVDSGGLPLAVHASAGRSQRLRRLRDLSTKGGKRMKTQDDLLFEKGLPANPDAERYVLGSILLNHANFDSVAAALASADFGLEKHRRIFARMCDLAKRGEPIDRVTIANELRAQGKLESVNGLSYLISLDEGLPELAHLDAYVTIVRDPATLRKLIAVCQMGISECLRGSEPTRNILERAERMLAELSAEAVRLASARQWR